MSGSERAGSEALGEKGEPKRDPTLSDLIHRRDSNSGDTILNYAEKRGQSHFFTV